MDTLTIVVLITCIAAVVVIAFAGAMWWQRRRRRAHSRALREEFGPEYERALRQSGDRTEAERELDRRQRRVQALDIRPLRPEQADRYREAWLATQARFVEEPQDALDDAERLLGDVMQARGYPAGDFERRVADLSVEHAQVAGRYRKAHGIATARRAGVEPETEQMRRALLDYRQLFMELLEDTPRREDISTIRRNGHEVASSRRRAG